VTPYYDDGNGIQIFLGDCRDILPTLEAGSVDLVLTDPPYQETSLNWDRLLVGWLELVRPLMSRQASVWCFGSLRSFLLNAEELAAWHLVQELVWEKHNGSIFHADRFRRVHEIVAHFVRRNVPWSSIYTDPQFTLDATARTVQRKAGRLAHTDDIGAAAYASTDGGPRLMRSVLQVRSCHGTAVHPTQKPEGIVRPPLLYSCPPGGLVLDPFMGSGTTIVVARQDGRRAIGIEIEERYCEIAVKRLQQSVMNLAVSV